MSELSALRLLERHLDLLPTEKQPLAQWLCEGGASADRLPGKLRQRFWHVLPIAQGSDEPKRLLRNLVLELLSQHRLEIVRRERIGSTRRQPLGPVLAWSRRS
jgi:hypothetical protein